MANTIDCNVCDDLKEVSPEFASLGITDTVCASLKNDTGLNPSLPILHTDCEDLEMMNDCLIGRPKDELEKYDNCDWRKFMRRFLWNLHEMLGGVICAVCGLWTNVHSLTGRVSSLENMVADICQLITQQINQNMDVYGTLEGSGWGPVPERRGGEITTLSGSPALMVGQNPSVWLGVGVYYRKMRLRDCSGSIKTYEWVQPYIRDYYYNTQVNFSDPIWRASVQQLKDWGWSDSLINFFSNWPQWWGGYSRAWGQQFESTIWMAITNGYLELRVIGASEVPFSNQTINGLTKSPLLHIS